MISTEVCNLQVLRSLSEAQLLSDKSKLHISVHYLCADLKTIYEKKSIFGTGKLKDFNGSVGNQGLDDGGLSLLEQLMKSTSPNAQQIDALWKALQWPAGM